MNRCAVIATHHKTGTVWMNSTFSAICRALDIKFTKVERNDAFSPEDSPPPIVVFQPHSEFANFPWLLDNPEHRVLHLIRDPRDIIISAMHYHRTAEEQQLHIRRRKFGGMTYQQKINTLANDHERYLFEMQNTSKKVIEAMCGWNYARPNCFECKYEDLVMDKEMVLFSRILRHLGFSEDELEKGRQEFWRKSLFGKKAGRQGKTRHLRSGEARQWPAVFDRRLAEAFLQNFGDALVGLGYEPDDSWINELSFVTGHDQRTGIVQLQR